MNLFQMIISKLDLFFLLCVYWKVSDFLSRSVFFSICRHKASKKQPSENTVVAYYFCEEQIPYRTSVKGRVVTLGQFKELLTKKGNYR